MDKKQIVQIIENFAPPYLAEKWDCSGWAVETLNNDIQKVMICLTVTPDVVKQAGQNGCDMIISHHPLFVVPLEFKGIDIYCAHTNLDRANGGTTDELINVLGLDNAVIASGSEAIQPFVRYVDYSTCMQEFTERLCKISDNVRVVNNKNVKDIKKIAFCGGSGSEFIYEAFENGADAFVTGDVKFHTAVESPIVLFDIGHFESERPVLKVFERLLQDKIEIVFANERSPFSVEY